MPAQTAITTAHSEMLGWPREKYHRLGFFAERKLICAWADRGALAKELAAEGGHIYPYGTLTQGLDQGDLWANTMKMWPPRAFAVADIRPLEGAITSLATTALPSGDTKLGDYALAVLTVPYATPLFEWVKLKGDAKRTVLLTEELAPAGEFITLDHTAYYRKTGSAGDDVEQLKPGEAPGKRITQQSYTVTLYNIAVDTTSTAWSAFVSKTSSLVNRCNAVSWTTGTNAFTFDIETLQYMWTKFSRTFQTGEWPTWTIQMRFLFCSHGWNKVWNPATSEFDYLYDSGGTKKILVPVTTLDDLLNF